MNTAPKRLIRPPLSATNLKDRRMTVGGHGVRFFKPLDRIPVIFSETGRKNVSSSDTIPQPLLQSSYGLRRRRFRATGTPARPPKGLSPRLLFRHCGAGEMWARMAAKALRADISEVWA
jgi:hypothetical protein